MRIAFIADPLDGFKLYKDTTFAMMEEAVRRGHTLFAAELNDLSADGNGVYLAAREFELTGVEPQWYQYQSAHLAQPLQGFDAVVMRKDPPFDAEYLYATHLFSLAERAGARIFNSGQSLRDYNEKLAILQHPEWIAPTRVTRDMNVLRAFLEIHGDIVLKPLDSMGGDGIFRVQQGDVNLSVILETITLRGTRTVMAQRFEPEIRHGDKRVLLIDGKPVDYCLARIPKAGETRGNLAAGGHGEARPLSAHDRILAESLGPVLAARGLLLVGLDIIGNILTEINVTSPTCFREIMDQTGVNVAALMLDALERHGRQ